MTPLPNHGITWAELVEQFIGTIVRCWPGTTRSLVLLLRVTYVAVTTLLLVGLWGMVSMLPWTIDGLIAAAACVAFAHFFERGEAE